LSNKRSLLENRIVEQVSDRQFNFVGAVRQGSALVLFVTALCSIFSKKSLLHFFWMIL